MPERQTNKGKDVMASVTRIGCAVMMVLDVAVG